MPADWIAERAKLAVADTGGAMGRLMVRDATGNLRWSGVGLAQLRLAAGMSRARLADLARLTTEELARVERSQGPAETALAAQLFGALRLHVDSGPSNPHSAFERILSEAREDMEPARGGTDER